MPDARTDWPRLLSLLVHELRTPVNVAGGYLKMLGGAGGQCLDDRQRRMIAQASRSVDVITALLADASEIARFERGEGGWSPRQGDMRSIVQAAVDGFAPPEGSGVTVECRAAASGTRIEADIERLQRAVGACLAALAREIPENGRVLVDITDGPNDTIVLTVAHASLLPTLDRDTAAWGPLDEWRGGLGLELALARRVVAHAQGRLESPVSSTRQPALRVVVPRAR